jgi:predicted SprT family Zn-dependent metalloprotease
MRFWYSYYKYTCVGCEQSVACKERVFDESKKVKKHFDYWCESCEADLKPEKVIRLEFFKASELQRT